MSPVYTTPTAVAAGGVACRLEIRGHNFSPGAQVVVDGERVDSIWESGERMRISLMTDMLTGRSSRTVRVVDTNGVESNLLNLRVFDADRRADAIAGWWERLDTVVDRGVAARSWTFGPDGLSCPVLERYSDSPAGVRTVQYFDKGRMEMTNPADTDQLPDQVTNGLLVVELVTGELQVGDREFEQLEPSGQPVAGDPDDDLGPTYAMLAEHTGRTPNRVGEIVDEQLRRDGSVAEGEEAGPEEIALVDYDDVTGHNVAEPFWKFLTMSGPILDGGVISDDQLFPNPVLIAGRPIIEPAWITAKVGGTAVDVLLQCFERRCLTYTPSNPPGWQVEAGNVGRHYFQWRYGD